MNENQTIEADIVECIQRDFPEDSVQDILTKILAASSSQRIQRCIAFAARGHRSHLDYLCQLARIDYRDVIMAAEYDRFDTQLYDFNQPIPNARIERN